MASSVSANLVQSKDHSLDKDKFLTMLEHLLDHYTVPTSQIARKVITNIWSEVVKYGICEPDIIDETLVPLTNDDAPGESQTKSTTMRVYWTVPSSNTWASLTIGNNLTCLLNDETRIFEAPHSDAQLNAIEKIVIRHLVPTPHLSPQIQFDQDANFETLVQQCIDLVDSISQSDKCHHLHLAGGWVDICHSILTQYQSHIISKPLWSIFQDTFYDVVDVRWIRSGRWLSKRILPLAVSKKSEWTLKTHTAVVEDSGFSRIQGQAAIELALELPLPVEQCSMVVPVVRYNCFRLLLDESDVRKIYIDVAEFDAKTSYYTVLTVVPTSFHAKKDMVGNNSKVVEFLARHDAELFEIAFPKVTPSPTPSTLPPQFVLDLFDHYRSNELPLDEPEETLGDDPFALAKTLCPSFWSDSD